MPSIMFVCTGNTCRSPMAQAIARHWINGGLLGDAVGFTVASAGVHAASGQPTTPETVAALRKWNIDFEHESIPLTINMIREADVIYCMTTGHRHAVERMVAGEPGLAEKLRMLSPTGDIDDPIGMGQPTYDALAQKLLDLIPRRLREEFSHAP
jgi:protein-tyrosine-phosphatase